MRNVIAADPTRAAAVDAAWTQLIGPGPMLTAAQRIGVIGAARAAWSGGASPDPAQGVASEAAHWLAVDAGGIMAATVADFEDRGLDRFTYLEIVGVVARLSNVDFYRAGLGEGQLGVPSMPDPSPATGNRIAGAPIKAMWVPEASPIMAPMVLDALPDEGDAFRALHEPMYLPFSEIGNRHYEDTLTRPQIEYVAARASYLNECFY